MTTIELTEDTMCAHDEHELKNYPRPWFHAKPKIPKGTRLKVEETWENFYGTYFRCVYKNSTYDIPMGKAKVIEDY